MKSTKWSEKKLQYLTCSSVVSINMQALMWGYTDTSVENKKRPARWKMLSSLSIHYLLLFVQGFYSTF